MKKSLFYLFFTAMILTVGISCSSDDDESVPQETSVLVGTWRLTNVDFTYMAEGGFPASDACIVELISAYEFKADHKFYYLLTDSAPDLFDPYASDYWNWSGDETSFSINQPNPMSPPYNFALQPTNLTMEEINGQWVMTFDSDMSNGSKAKFRLVKQALDLSKAPALTDAEGNHYECNFFEN